MLKARKSRMPEEASQTINPKPKFSWVKSLSNILIALIIFGLGYGLGSGDINLRGHRSVQNNLPAKLDYSSVDKVYNSLRRNFDGQLDVNNLLNGIKHGLARSTGDPYTDYFTPDEAKIFNDQLNGTFQGIGAVLGKDKNDNLIVVSPISGFPAQKAGLKSKDIIAAVNNETTQNMSIDQAVSKIRGPKGTAVTLKIIRGDKTITLKIIRDDIKIPSVNYKILEPNIGYIQINEFSADTVSLATKAAESFRQAGVKGIIMDLRGNPGGELNAAVGLSSLWLKEDATVLTERRDGQVIKTHKADGNDILNGVKTVVLIDSGSASASEIVAGALRDNQAAVLMGVKSFGKGSVQEVISLPDDSMLKVTIARWYTPSGKNIDKQGLVPDRIIERSDRDIEANKDPQLDYAKSYLGS